MKKLIRSASLVLTTLLITATVLSAADVTKFSDVPEEHWAYEMVMKMTEAGLFRGTTEPIDGVGTFSPDKEMTRAEFIAVALRATFPDEAKSIANDAEKWWNKYYMFARLNDILKQYELDDGDLDKPITREEMAMILVRCVEEMGESLTVRVETTQIADYVTIGDYYKDYVLDCFSFGLLCGIDDNGTFAPTDTLKRSEAATVLCRLTDKASRIEITLPEPESKDDTEETKPDTDKPNPPAENDPIEFPWENGGKKTSEYTWAEYEALPDNMKNAFYDSFESTELFAAWVNRVHPEVNNSGKTDDDPSDDDKTDGDNTNDNNTNDNNTNGDKTDGDKTNDDKTDDGNDTTEKKPSDYTWEEYLALSDDEKNTFRDKFESQEEFSEWLLRVQPDTDTLIPWENGGKQPSEYSWDEYNALSKEQQEAFYKSFESHEDLLLWYNRVQPGSGVTSDLPWENGGKQPSEYTWEEVQAMPEEMQEEFFNSFDSMEEFEKWLIKNLPSQD